MNLAEHRRLRLFTLCALYVAQGIPWGFMAFTLPSYLAARGLDAAAVGAVLAMTTAPYAFKLVWGPLIDGFPGKTGRRRPWIVFAQLMMAATIAAMVAIPDVVSNVSVLAWMVFLHTVFNSMQDVAVDGLAVDLLEPPERARTQGFMYAAKWAGVGLGGWGMAKLAARFDLRTALGVQVVVLLGIMMLPLLAAEGSGPLPRQRTAVRAVISRFRRALQVRVVSALVREPGFQSAVACGFVMLGSRIAGGALSAVSPVLFTQDLGWSAEDWSSLSAGPGLACGLVGSVLGGIWADKAGHRRWVALTTVGVAASHVLWAGLAPYWMDRATVYATFWIEPLLQGMLSVSLFALCMDVCSPKFAASQFAVYMALLNASSTLGSWVAGRAAQIWTYPGMWLVAAAVQLAPLAALRFVRATSATSRTTS